MKSQCVQIPTRAPIPAALQTYSFTVETCMAEIGFAKFNVTFFQDSTCTTARFNAEIETGVCTVSADAPDDILMSLAESLP
jgi:hypothetical protein